MRISSATFLRRRRKYAGVGSTVSKAVIESWRQHYNEVKPHSSVQYLTPTEFEQQLRQDPQATVFH